MRVKILAMRHHDGTATQQWLESLPGAGTAYLTDTLYAPIPEGGRRSLYPDGPEHWEELPRPGDLALAAALAAQGADLLYRYPAAKRRRVFARWPGQAPKPKRRPFQRV